MRDTTVEWVRDPEGFAALKTEWDRLLPGDARPFDLHCWYLAWWEAFGAGREPAICTVRRDGDLVGALPLLREGRRLSAMANTHSPVFRPLARDEAAREQLLGAVLAEGASELRLIALPEGDPSLERLRAAGGAPMQAAFEAGQVSPLVETSGSFEDWRKRSKPRWGAPLERFRRKMGRDYEAVTSIVEAPADLDAELEEGFRVEASGWKGEQGTAILSAPETHAFYLAVARAFHARDELRLSRIVLDGRTAAFDLCLLHGGRLYLLKTGFDESFRRLAPGLVMRLSIVERCFELGLDAHELLGDDSEWKRKFATGERRHLELRAYPRTPLGSLRRAYRGRLRPHLRDAYRRLRARRS
ncbi:MAG TPA: GNAT family N-acetyltransferase [Solirubrobacterales bacterium]|nr:GNAT family N-acetyltransferase [Solirubrobacterales bacterium]